jgi:hypothetical protein
MSWAKFDDQYPDHPKIVEVGPLGMALHTAATCYCARYLTDGFIPSAMIGRLINWDGINNADGNAVTNKQVTDKLTRAGLLEIVPGGYKVHDYLEYNPPAEHVKAERAANKARQARWKKNNAVSNTVNNSAPSPSPSLNKNLAPDGANEPAGGEAESIVKNPGAFAALQRNEQRKAAGEVDHGKFPELLWPHLDMFVKETGIKPNVREISFWIRSLTKWKDNVPVDYMRRALEKMRREGLTVKSPESAYAIGQDLYLKANGHGERYAEVHGDF